MLTTICLLRSLICHFYGTSIFAARRSPSPRPSRYTRAGSEPYVPPPTYWSRAPSVSRAPSAFERARSLAPSLFDRARSLAPRPLFRASSLEPLDELFDSKLADRNFERAGSPSPTPVKAGRWGPRPTEVSYDANGTSKWLRLESTRVT